LCRTAFGVRARAFASDRLRIPNRLRSRGTAVTCEMANMSNDVRLKELAISETGFVFDPHYGGTFMLNATGQVIVKALRHGWTPDEIVEQLCTTFDEVNRDVVEDVRDFLRTLTDFSLLSR
jgi:hypothetical protein